MQVQPLVNKVFKYQLERNIEAYVDDMLVISPKASDHVKGLTEMFSIRRKYKLKLNLMNCIFEATSGKFLGFLITNRGIEVNLEKIEVIINMSKPRTISVIQRLNGRIAALTCFLVRPVEKSLPFFKVLRGATEEEGKEKRKLIT